MPPTCSSVSIVLRRSSVLLSIAALLLLAGQTASAADTADNVLTTGTDLSVPGNYSAGTPGTSSDVTFTASIYSGTNFTTNGATLGIGTLDDLDTTQKLTILNTNSGSPTTITLNDAGGNATSGSQGADLIYVVGGGNLSIGGGAGGLTLAAGKAGNFDNNGTLVISSTLSLTSNTVTFTGTGATTISGNITSTTGGLTLNYGTGGTMTLSGTNSIGGALTMDGVTIALSGTTSVASLALGTNSNTTGYPTFSPDSVLNVSAGSGLTIGGSSVTRAAGTTLDIGSTGSIFAGSTLASNGIYVSAASNGIAFATAASQTTWASISASGSLGALSTYQTGAGNYISTSNIDVGNSVASATDSPSGNFTVNTLRFNAAGLTLALSLSGTGVVSTGGILVTSAGTTDSITGGTLESGGGKELLVIDNGSLNIGSVIADSAGGASALNLVGSGTTSLTASNTYSGQTTIGGGATLEIGGTAAGGGSAGTLGTGAVAGYGTLVFNRSNAYSLANQIGPNNGQTTLGPVGTLIFAGSGSTTFTYNGTDFLGFANLPNNATQTILTMNPGAGPVTFSSSSTFATPYSGNNQTTNLVNNSGSLLTFNGIFTNVQATGVLTIAVTGTGTGGVTFNNAIQNNGNNPGGRSTSLTINTTLSGTGAVTLLSAPSNGTTTGNIYNGGTTITSGILRLSNGATTGVFTGGMHRRGRCARS